MSTSISNPIFRLILLLLCSMLFHIFIPKRIKDHAIPLAFALIIVEQNIMPFFGGGGHFLLVAVYWVAMIIVLDGMKIREFSSNKVFASFCVFWGYYIFTGFLSNDKYYAVTYLVNTLIELLMVGYFAGIWVMRTPGGLSRLIKYTMFLSFIVFGVYAKFGFTGELDASGRAMLSEHIVEEGLGQNVNDIGLALVPIMALSYIAVFETRRIKISLKTTIISLVVLLISMYFIMRTGSRNSALAFLPCGIYMMSKLREKDSINQAKKWIVAILLLLAVTVVVYKFMQSAGSLRFITYSGETSNMVNANLDDVSSGRLTIFANYMRDMNAIDYIIGKGPFVIKQWTGNKTVGGAMSVYMTLVRDVGLLGLFLLFIHFCVVIGWSRRNGALGKIVLLIFMCWAITGVAEQIGIVRGKIICLVQGFAYALCTRKYHMFDGNDCSNYFISHNNLLSQI